MCRLSVVLRGPHIPGCLRPAHCPLYRHVLSATACDHHIHFMGRRPAFEYPNRPTIYPYLMMRADWFQQRRPQSTAPKAMKLASFDVCCNLASWYSLLSTPDSEFRYN
jgi:hypothetical protein